MNRAAWVSAAVLVGLFSASTVGASDPTGEILFYGEAESLRQLWILDLESGRSRPVGSSGSRPDHYPSWSADGQLVAFESYRAGGWHPWVMSAEGNQARRVTESPAHDTRHYEFDPSFAPDNRTVVFIKNFDLYTITMDRPEPARVGRTTPTLFETAPAFSPDMHWIAFSGYDETDESQHIYRVTAEGNDRRQLTSGKGVDLAPVWSPDGEWLLFYSDRSGSLELYEMAADGSEVQPILNAEAAARVGFVASALVDPWDNDNGATEQYRADYSPDGRWVVFSRNVDGDRELFIAERGRQVSPQQEIRRVTRRQGLDGFPVWRP